eukprot:133609-Prymnesium_polylepis.2
MGVRPRASRRVAHLAPSDAVDDAAHAHGVVVAHRAVAREADGRGGPRDGKQPVRALGELQQAAGAQEHLRAARRKIGRRRPIQGCMCVCVPPRCRGRGCRRRAIASPTATRTTPLRAGLDRRTSSWSCRQRQSAG